MKTKNPNDFVLKKLEHLGYDSYHLFPPRGHGAGGLALFWNSKINIEVLYSNANLIDTVIIYQGKSFYASFIHGDCDRKQRLMQWDHMLNRAENRDAPWFVTGDFNDLLSDEEKLGGPTRPESSFVDLRTFFSEGDLFDLRHAGDPLSWRGQRGDHLVRCRLDRAVANRLWAECYPTACCQYLEYESSDHKPLSSFFEHEAKRRRGLI